MQWTNLYLNKCEAQSKLKQSHFLQSFLSSTVNVKPTVVKPETLAYSQMSSTHGLL